MSAPRDPYPIITYLVEYCKKAKKELDKRQKVLEKEGEGIFVGFAGFLPLLNCLPY